MDKTSLLELTLDSFYTKKNEADMWKKLADTENKQIKTLMSDLELEEFEYNNIKAKLNVSKRYSFIEEALLEKIKQLGLNHLIKTKEIVDMEALESAIYNGKLDAKELENCQQLKEVVSLRVTGAN